jgi:aspartate racemase
MREMLVYIESNDQGGLVTYLLAELKRLELAGAHLAALASNTPHLVFDELQKRSSLPLVSIIEETCHETVRLNLNRVGLFGTKFTMQAGLYEPVLGQAGVSVLTPNPEEQRYIHERYMGELVPGRVLGSTRRSFLRIARRMVEEEGIQGLILGGTELPLALQPEDDVGVPLLNSADIHVRAILELL